jgi:hypothetical protein
MPIPAIPKKWTDAKVVPARGTSQAQVNTLVTLAKLSKNPAAITATNSLKQKYGNWLIMDSNPTKAEAKTKIAPTVVTLYNAAVTAVSAAKLPTGEYNVALKTYTSPKFMHNATQAGTLPEWTFEFWDTGVAIPKRTFKISMTNNMYNANENKQAERMSDAAVDKVKALTKATVVHVVKS